MKQIDKRISSIGRSYVQAKRNGGAILLNRIVRLTFGIKESRSILVQYERH